MTLSYFEIWRGIDNLAAQKGLSPSALAQKAGLDPTSFNKSKREGPDGRQRWLSMETLNKVLAATNTSFLDFMLMAGDQPIPGTKAAHLPLVSFSMAAKDALFDENGLPLDSISGWEKIDFPCVAKPGMWALEMTTNTYAPVYPEGCLLLIAPQTEIRRRDRVVIQLMNGPMILGELVRETNHHIDIQPLTTDATGLSVERQQLAFMARIVWASQ